MYTREVIVSKERMFSENSFQAIRFGSHHYAVLKNARALVTMNYIYVFPYQYLPYEWQGTKEREESNVTLHHWWVWQMIDSHTIGHIPHTEPTILKFIRDEAYFMATLN